MKNYCFTEEIKLADENEQKLKILREEKKGMT